MIKVPKSMIDRCLLAQRDRTPDNEAEQVVADWAEETGFYGLAAGMRDTSENVRWTTLATFLRMMDPDWIRRAYEMKPMCIRCAKGIAHLCNGRWVERNDETDRGFAGVGVGE